MSLTNIIWVFVVSACCSILVHTVYFYYLFSIFKRTRKPEDNKTYSIDTQRRTITCRLCGRTSHNSNDVQQLFCGYCHHHHHPLGIAVLAEELRWATGKYEAVLKEWHQADMHNAALKKERDALRTEVWQLKVLLTKVCTAIREENVLTHPKYDSLGAEVLKAIGQ